ncbi:hypothetical protein P886_1671 [Alteromonadaceae bacterium 2753L.S.0a.02]|nr:hypothetical protein P886_1671 [Alteromonadaceae bacterium 2753L.S.0a.02]
MQLKFDTGKMGIEKLNALKLLRFYFVCHQNDVGQIMLSRYVNLSMKETQYPVNG